MADTKKQTGRKNYSAETKAQALEALKTQTLSAVSERFGVSVPTLSAWKRGSQPAADPLPQESEPDEQNEELEFLRLEKEYLKTRIERLEKGSGNPVQGS